MVGVSIIDDATQELFSITLKNTNIIFQKEEKFIKEDDDLDERYNSLSEKM